MPVWRPSPPGREPVIALCATAGTCAVPSVAAVVDDRSRDRSLTWRLHLRDHPRRRRDGSLDRTGGHPQPGCVTGRELSCCTEFSSRPQWHRQECPRLSSALGCQPPPHWAISLCSLQEGSAWWRPCVQATSSNLGCFMDPFPWTGGTYPESLDCITFAVASRNTSSAFPIRSGLPCASAAQAL